MANGSKTWIIARLGIPLLVLFGLSVGLHELVDADGFFLNLATELIGIGVTVAYVDRVLRRHDAEQWGPTRALIDGRIRLTANSGLTGIRTALGIDDLRELELGRETPKASEYRKAIRRVVVPQLPERLRGLTQEGWQELGVALRASASDADLILRTLGSRLLPNEYSALLNLQDRVRRALLTYEIDSANYGSDYKPGSPADLVLHEINLKAAITDVGAILEQLLQLGDLVSDETHEQLRINAKSDT